MHLKILGHPILTNLNFHMPMIVDLSHPLIMLQGENGSGKSTLLRSIYYALRGETVESYIYRLEPGGVKTHRRVGFRSGRRTLPSQLLLAKWSLGSALALATGALRGLRTSQIRLGVGWCRPSWPGSSGCWGPRSACLHCRRPDRVGETCRPHPRPQPSASPGPRRARPRSRERSLEVSAPHRRSRIVCRGPYGSGLRCPSGCSGAPSPLE